jgi:hypothetical protein
MCYYILNILLSRSDESSLGMICLSSRVTVSSRYVTGEWAQHNKAVECATTNVIEFGRVNIFWE